MRSSWKSLVAVAAALVVAPQLAAADDVQEQLNQMQARMAQLEESLKATQDELNTAQVRVEQQEAVLSSTVEDSKAVSALSSFLNDTEFGGAVAASYNWNFNDPAKGVANNISTAATHPTHNTFQFDQVHFSMAKEATEKSRAGFAVDMLYGAIADAANGTVSGNAPWLVQANVSYLAPMAGGLTVTGGRYGTPIGAESVYTEDNWNITRGLVWGLQPISHTGLVVAGSSGYFSDQAAVANGTTDANFDANSSKTGLFTVGWANDSMGLGMTYAYIDDPGATVAAPTATDGNSQHFIDVVGTWDPSDNLAVWVNFDYIKTKVKGAATGDVSSYAVALASRMAVSDATGVSIRGEFVGTRPSTPTVGTPDKDQFSLTGTVDHALTDNLTAKVEIRYDNDDSSPFDVVGAAGTENNQVTAIGQLVYSF